MRTQRKFFSVNWIDGMKINKNHFIAQDNAWRDSLNEIGSLSTSPLRFGILPTSHADEDNYEVKISIDNQNILRVAVLACQAITPGGIRIDIPGLINLANTETDGVPALSFPFSTGKTETNWWVILTIHPFLKKPTGDPDLSEDPPRYPSVLPSYSLQVVSDAEYSQYSFHPYSITIGKITANNNIISVDNDYIPPCFTINASPDLVMLHTELDQFMARLETLCSLIVQKIFKKNQQNEISELVMFLCDRIILFLGPAITNLRWVMIHESPAALFAGVASLARVMKNSIDLRIGSGKEEMLNYLSEWSELKQGEMESMLTGIAAMRFDNNDINKNINQIVQFVKVTGKLFETLNKLEFIGKRKDGGLFIKEEVEKNPPKRRFLG